MLRATTLLLLISVHAGLSYGMQCSSGEQNFLEQILTSCPGVLDSSDKSYCCYDIERNQVYCCDAFQFAKMATWASATLIAVVVIVVSVIVFCISCLCCICCRRYRRRNQGTVYGRVQVPHVVQVIHTPANVLPQSDYVVNSGMSAAPASASPHDIYAKPPPYNTSYVHPTTNNTEQRQF